MPPVSKSEYKRRVLELVKQWERELDGKNAIIVARQLREWQRLSITFDKLLNELLKKVSGLSANQIIQLQQYKAFRAEIDKVLMQYARYNENLISIAQMDYGNLALQNSNTVLELIGVPFSRLPKEAISKIIGLTADGSPLHDILIRRFGERADQAEQILIEGIARGQNPIVVAREMRKQLDISVFDSNRLARTEAINTYSQTTVDAYRESGIVERYDWIAESDACSECLSRESNSPYAIDSNIMPSEHPHCRCVLVPNI